MNKKNKAEKVIERIVKNEDWKFWHPVACYGSIEMVLKDKFFGNCNSDRSLPIEYLKALDKIFPIVNK